MPEYSQPLGDVVRQARKKMYLTQDKVAAAVDIDSRTVINIENYRGNPKMEVLFPLIRYRENVYKNISRRTALTAGDILCVLTVYGISTEWS